MNSKICENDLCQASFVPEHKNQYYCKPCFELIKTKTIEYMKGGQEHNMTQSIKDAALSYVPKSTRNIVELKSVPIDLVTFEETAKDQDGSEFTYKYIEVASEKYRMPDSVLKDLKAILSKKPTLKSFSVTKTGEGRNTRYTVIPLD